MAHLEQEQRSFFMRRPVVATLCLILMIVGPMVVILLLAGVPPLVVGLAAVGNIAFGSYVSYLTVRQSDDPGPVLKFLQDRVGGFWT